MTVADDVRRAAAWIAAALPPIRDEPDGLAAWCCASLGLAIAAAVLGDEQLEAAAASAAHALASRVAQRPRGDPGCDERQLALVAALALAEPGAFAEPLRGAAAPVTVDDALLRSIAFASEAEVAARCDAVEAGGLAPCGAAERRELALIAAARGFSAARARTNPACALQLLRVVAAERLDPDLTADALQHVRECQRVDGAFGDLPVRTTFAGDIRYVVHLPRTVEALWLIHDAVAPAALVRRARQRARSAEEHGRPRRSADSPRPNPTTA